MGTSRSSKMRATASVSWALAPMAGASQAYASGVLPCEHLRASQHRKCEIIGVRESERAGDAHEAWIGARVQQQLNHGWVAMKSGGRERSRAGRIVLCLVRLQRMERSQALTCRGRGIVTKTRTSAPLASR
jgi:hypothetical protein